MSVGDHLVMDTAPEWNADFGGFKLMRIFHAFRRLGNIKRSLFLGLGSDIVKCGIAIEKFHRLTDHHRSDVRDKNTTHLIDHNRFWRRLVVPFRLSSDINERILEGVILIDDVLHASGLDCGKIDRKNARNDILSITVIYLCF